MIKNTITYVRPSLDVKYDYVGIIDGLSAADRKQFGITDDLIGFLAAAAIQAAIGLVTSGPELLAALVAFHKEAVSGHRFLLHFVSHGNDDGIFAGQDFVSWEQIRPYLERIHKATDESLILNMSTCRGLHGARAVDRIGPQYPFFGLIGAKDDLLVSDALAANRSVYTKWIAGVPVQKIVPEVNQELGRDVLYCLSAEGYRQLHYGP